MKLGHMRSMRDSRPPESQEKIPSALPRNFESNTGAFDHHWKDSLRSLHSQRRRSQRFLESSQFDTLERRSL